jgi:hypothetical protein
MQSKITNLGWKLISEGTTATDNISLENDQKGLKVFIKTKPGAINLVGLKYWTKPVLPLTEKVLFYIKRGPPVIKNIFNSENIPMSLEEFLIMINGLPFCEAVSCEPFLTVRSGSTTFQEGHLIEVVGARGGDVKGYSIDGKILRSPLCDLILPGLSRQARARTCEYCQVLRRSVKTWFEKDVEKAKEAAAAAAVAVAGPQQEEDVSVCVRTIHTHSFSFSLLVLNAVLHRIVFRLNPSFSGAPP